MLLRNVKKVFLILLALCPCKAESAYRHTIVNGTSLTAKLHVHYSTLFCGDEKPELKPGATVTLEAGSCGILSINAVLQAQGKPPIEAQAYSHGLFLGNGSWKIASDNNDPNKFIIVQTKSENLGQIISDRFGDTKVTRSVDYGIRIAALESALRIATASLDAAKAVSKGSLAAAREIAQTSLTASQQILKLSENISAGTLRGSADAAQGILEGAKIGTVHALEGAKMIISKGPLSWIDINKMEYIGNYKELKTGVLGNITVQAELFGKPVPLSLSIDPSSSNLETLYEKSFKPLVDALVESLKDAIVKPVKEATSKTEKTLIANTKIIAATEQLPTTEQLQKVVNAALVSSAELKKTQDQATASIQKLLDQSEKKAEQALAQSRR